MFARVRNLWLAGGSALALTIVLSGVVAAATVITALNAVTPTPTATVPDTTGTWEDADGNGVDDDCQTDVVADPIAAASAELAVDTNLDGTISVSEAAHSDRTGGANCNHGGYVSIVAHGQCDATPPADSTDGTATGDDASADVDADEATQGDETASEDGDATEAADSGDCTTDEVAPTTADQAPTCDAAPTTTEPADEPAVDATTEDVPTEDPAPNAHGKKVSDVARSDAVGGKNCNHGGAVSEAAKKDHAADKAARDAAKAAREAARDAAKAARDAARSTKQHGKHH
jgi:hypothetical protein